MASPPARLGPLRPPRLCVRLGCQSRFFAPLLLRGYLTLTRTLDKNHISACNGRRNPPIPRMFVSHGPQGAKCKPLIETYENSKSVPSNDLYHSHALDCCWCKGANGLHNSPRFHRLELLISSFRGRGSVRQYRVRNNARWRQRKFGHRVQGEHGRHRVYDYLQLQWHSVGGWSHAV